MAKIKRIVILSTDANGRTQAETIAKTSKKRRKKRSRGLKYPESILRKLSRGASRGFDEYRDEHDKSGRKRRDGALRDMLPNVMRGTSKGVRKAKLPRIFW
jgi:hypothetical protein